MRGWGLIPLCNPLLRCAGAARTRSRTGISSAPRLFARASSMRSFRLSLRAVVPVYAHPGPGPKPAWILGFSAPFPQTSRARYTSYRKRLPAAARVKASGRPGLPGTDAARGGPARACRTGFHAHADPVWPRRASAGLAEDGVKYAFPADSPSALNADERATQFKRTVKGTSGSGLRLSVI